MLTEQTQVESISLTPAAVVAVRDLLEKRNLHDYALRVFISGGGCSGFQYGMALENNIREEDITSEIDGVKVVVDEVSIEYLHGATVDFVDTPQGTGFKIDNPNFIPSCGCGSPSGSDGACGCSGCS
jgi:iron-sulfur cluster assembly protein